MSDKFRKLAENVWVSPQVEPADIAAAKALGVTLVINNRPDGEEPGQPAGAEIEAAAKAAGLSYAAIPVDRRGLSPDHLDAFDAAIAENAGGVLAYCRSGMRSTTVRAFARARVGDDADAIIAEAADAGYDISGHRAALESASGKS